MQVDLHVRAVSRGNEHAVDKDAERQQKELETSLQGTGATRWLAVCLSIFLYISCD